MSLVADGMGIERTPCCDKILCCGCFFAQMKIDKLQKCPFCRLPMDDLKTEEEMEPDVIRKAAADDVSSLNDCGRRFVKNGDNNMAVKVFTRSAELGDPEGFWNLSQFCHSEVGRKMYLFCLKSAAIGGLQTLDTV